MLEAISADNSQAADSEVRAESARRIERMHEKTADEGGQEPTEDE